MAIIRVLKAFTFTYPPRAGVRGQPHERIFLTGPKSGNFPNGEPREYEVDDVVANHPWICEDFADGKIESPAQALKRANEESAKAKSTAAEAEAAQGRAQAAISRLHTKAEQDQARNTEEKKALDTPVGQLKGGGGADVDKPVSDQTGKSRQK